jgi:hypothetical protein
MVINVYLLETTINYTFSHLITPALYIEKSNCVKVCNVSLSKAACVKRPSVNLVALCANGDAQIYVANAAANSFHLSQNHKSSASK